MFQQNVGETLGWTDCERSEQRRQDRLLVEVVCLFSIVYFYGVVDRA